MADFQVEDVVVRKSYNRDIHFKITDIRYGPNNLPIYTLKGILYRLDADSGGGDLIKLDTNTAYRHIQRKILNARSYATMQRPLFRGFLFNRTRIKTGRILHLDSSEDFLDICLKHYKDSRLQAAGEHISEGEQPYRVRALLEKYRPDILVCTGHDAIKKDSGNKYSLDNYRNSTFFVQSVKSAREFEPDNTKLFVYAGACQSYYEAIMDAGANFASSPGRILINALDPAIVSEKVSLTERKFYVYPADVARALESGSKGIWGIKSRGQMTKI